MCPRGPRPEGTPRGAFPGPVALAPWRAGLPPQSPLLRVSPRAGKSRLGEGELCPWSTGDGDPLRPPRAGKRAPAPPWGARPEVLVERAWEGGAEGGRPLRPGPGVRGLHPPRRAASHQGLQTGWAWGIVYKTRAWERCVRVDTLSSDMSQRENLGKFAFVLGGWGRTVIYHLTSPLPATFRVMRRAQAVTG